MGHGLTFTDSPTIEPTIANRLRTVCGVVGLIGIAASLGLAFSAEDGMRNFYFSYLTAFFTCVTISLGCLFYVILHHLTRATWSTAFRRIAENIAAVLPWALVGFLPVLVGLHDLYHWSHADVVAADPILQGKAGYLNTPFFIARALIYVALWSAMALFFRRMSVRQDETGDTNLTFRMRWWAPLSTLTFALSVTYAAFDWIMSLNPHWFSTMFGVIIFAGCMVSGFASLILMGNWLQKNGALTTTLTTGNYHDLGKLMWGFIIFWTYTSFSQYFLIYSANIPEETFWYNIREINPNTGETSAWFWVSMGLIFGHFFFPFLYLLFYKNKINGARISFIALWILAFHLLDLYWNIIPGREIVPGAYVGYEARPVVGTHLFWGIASLIGIGCLCARVVIKSFNSQVAEVVPVRDPRILDSLNHHE